VIAFTPVVVGHAPVTATGVCPSTFPFRIQTFEAQLTTPWVPSTDELHALEVICDLLEHHHNLPLPDASTREKRIIATNAHTLLVNTFRTAKTRAPAWVDQLGALLAQLAHVDHLGQRARAATRPDVMVTAFFVNGASIFNATPIGVAPGTYPIVALREFDRFTVGGFLVPALSPGQLVSVTMMLSRLSPQPDVEVSLVALGQEIR